MPKILLVKTSSLGDVVHNLPVASDMRAAVPGAEIAWVVEESFAAIPRLHPAVSRVIPAAVRRWRKAPWRGAVRDEIRAFLGALRDTRYDAVIDTQGLFKSALIARAAHGRRCGLDWPSAREPLGFFYDRTFNVPWGQHAVERNRSLAAQALGYQAPAEVDYGIRAQPQRFGWMPEGRYAVLLHASSAENKLWAEQNWCALAEHLHASALSCVLPWGSDEERRRSERLAERMTAAVVPPALPLADVASLIAGAELVAGVDTGITHLAVALGRPTVGIYCATDPQATGLYGGTRLANVGGAAASPAVDEVIAGLTKARAAEPGVPPAAKPSESRQP